MNYGKINALDRQYSLMAASYPDVYLMLRKNGRVKVEWELFLLPMTACTRASRSVRFQWPALSIVQRRRACGGGRSDGVPSIVLLFVPSRMDAFVPCDQFKPITFKENSVVESVKTTPVTVGYP